MWHEDLLIVSHVQDTLKMQLGMHEEKLFRFFLSEEGSIALKCIFKG